MALKECWRLGLPSGRQSAEQEFSTTFQSMGAALSYRINKLLDMTRVKLVASGAAMSKW